MPDYTFEIVKPGHIKTPARVLSLPDGRAIWGCVEALALRTQGIEGAFIHVRNSHGETVVRAGISTALASIESCTCEDCPLKKELKLLKASGRRSVPDYDVRIECPLSGASADAEASISHRQGDVPIKHPHNES